MDSTRTASSIKSAAKAVGVLIIGVVLFAVVTNWMHNSGMTAPNSRPPLPTFSMPDLDGRVWRLEEHRGKVVLINLWATWCPPCRQETPDLVALAKRYGPKGVDFAGVSLDQGDPESVRAFAARNGIPYPVLLPQGPSPVTSGVSAIPVTLLIDRHGRLAERYTGAVSPGEVDASLDRLLAEP